MREREARVEKGGVYERGKAANDVISSFCGGFFLLTWLFAKENSRKYTENAKKKN